MTKRFVIATDPLTADQEKALIEKFGTAGWWHWLPNFWLVKDFTDQLSASTISAALRQINETARAMVLEVDYLTWSALTRPDAEGRDMAKWLHDTWTPKPDE